MAAALVTPEQAFRQAVTLVYARGIPYLPGDVGYTEIIDNIAPYPRGSTALCRSINLTISRDGDRQRNESTILHYLIKCRSLQQIELNLGRGSDLFWAAVFHFTAGLCSLKTYRINIGIAPPVVADLVVAWLPRLIHMTSLAVSRRSDDTYTAQIAAALPICSNLTTLDVMFIKFNAANLAQMLVNAPQITHLRLDSNTDNFGCLAGGLHLQILEINRRHSLLEDTAALLTGLPHCSNLRELILLPRLTDQSFAAVLQILTGLPQLTAFTISVSTAQGAVYHQFLQSRSSITKLSFGTGTLIRDQIASILTATPALSHLLDLSLVDWAHPDHDLGPDLLQLLRITPHLRKLSLGRFITSEASLIAILTALSGLHNLELFTIEACPIRLSMLGPLRQMFISCPNLQTLGFRKCRFSPGLLTQLAPTFSQLVNLRELALEFTILGDVQDTQNILLGVGRMPALRALRLTGMTLPPSQMDNLAVASEQNRNLASIEYPAWSAPIGNQSLGSFPRVARALRHNQWTERMESNLDVMVLVLMVARRRWMTSDFRLLPPEIWRLIFQLFIEL